ncbi:anthranilate phosphoribosyltransferase [Planctomicrobium sp. SH664]|uniref:anthranilate phosphoribosyltransferase n=1 Tax=Planctomicrobium sp. SH664 TaxID=3448125 RepID=UPI003F5BB141
MQPEIRTALEQLISGESPDRLQMEQATTAIMSGRCDEVEIAALLTGLAVQGIQPAHLAGVSSVMRARCTKIRSRRQGLMDTCGTGGDRLHTFNISTATALVVAAAGVPVAKHGNRSVSSSSGSAEVLETLGVNISLTAEQAGACLDELGICYCYARLLHEAMKHVGPVRQKLTVPTIFNLVGPLTNPAGAEFQLLGSHRNTNAEKIAHAVRELGTTRAFVVCGNNELDEVALWGSTRVWEIEGDQVRTHTWTAADFHLPECRVEDLRVNSAAESAAIIRGVLAGEQGPARNMVLANTAAALLCHRAVASLEEGVAEAARTIDSGAAADLLQRLITWTNQQ